MATQHDNRFAQATEGLRIIKGGGVVRVQDSETTWLCRARAWHAAQAQLESQTPCEDEPDYMTGEQAAYAALCRAVSSPILSVGGSDRGSESERRTLARWAAKAGLLPESLRSMVASADRAPEWPGRAEAGRTGAEARRASRQMIGGAKVGDHIYVLVDHLRGDGQEAEARVAADAGGSPYLSVNGVIPYAGMVARWLSMPFRIHGGDSPDQGELVATLHGGIEVRAGAWAPDNMGGRVVVASGREFRWLHDAVMALTPAPEVPLFTPAIPAAEAR
jgi:hypothetical protein